MKVTINELPTSLKSIGGSAFYNGGPNIHITKIPNDVTTIPMMTFYLTPNVSISEFGSNGTGSKLNSIDTQAFYECGSGITSITIYSSVKTIGSGAFLNYGKASLQNAYFANAEGSYGGDASYMGLDSSVAVTYGFTG